VSKHWKPKKQTVTLDGAAPRVSRIRRDPVRQPSPAELKKAELKKAEREIWGGVSGVMLYGAVLAVIIVGVAIATVFRDDPDAARRARMFRQCYESDGPNCVVTGDTIYVAGQKLRIAGIEAPQIDHARCPEERGRGIDSAVRLADLLNSGKVSVGPAFRDSAGREVRSVELDGLDLGQRMIDEGIAKPADGSSTDWCG
jgi:micrococcal nuclease